MSEWERPVVENERLSALLRSIGIDPSTVSSLTLTREPLGKGKVHTMVTVVELLDAEKVAGPGHDGLIAVERQLSRSESQVIAEGLGHRS